MWQAHPLRKRTMPAIPAFGDSTSPASASLEELVHVVSPPVLKTGIRQRWRIVGSTPTSSAILQVRRLSGVSQQTVNLPLFELTLGVQLPPLAPVFGSLYVVSQYRV